MNKILFLIMTLGLVSLPMSVPAAGPKIKHVGSIYTDTAGIPLHRPAGVTIVGEQLLVADSGGKRVLSYTYKNGTVTPGKIFPLPDMYPLMVQKTSNNELLVLDGRDREIVILNSTGSVKGKLTIKGLPGPERIVPRSIKITADGLLLILDILSERVLVLDEAGTYQRQLSFPKGYGAMADTTSDKQGNIYLLDSVRAAVYVARSGNIEFTPLTPEMKGHMNFPTSIASDNQGSLFLVDKNGSGLAIVGVDGTFKGRRLSMGWSDGSLYYPSQISMNDHGDLFIADTENHRIQQFSVSE